MRILAWFAAGFGGACLLGCFPYVPHGQGAVAAGLLWTAALFLWHRTRLRHGEAGLFRLCPRQTRLRRRCYAVSRRLAVLLAGSVLAFVWMAGYTDWVRVPAQALAGTEQTVTGRVVEQPEATSVGGGAVLLRLSRPLETKLLLYGPEEWRELSLGEVVTASVRLERADGRSHQQSRGYAARGIYLLGYCSQPPERAEKEALPGWLYPAAAAQRLKEGIRLALDPVAAPLGVALTSGDVSGLSRGFRSALSRTGTAHAVSVSGMHVSFLVGLCLLLVGGNRRRVWWVVPGLLFYALMVGATPSAVRAVVMQTAALGAPLLGRESDTPTALGGSLLVLLLQNPYAAASVSLQLSFAAVGGILLLGEPLSRRMGGWLEGRLPDWKGWPGQVLSGAARTGVAALSVTLGALLLTQPLCWLYFGQISLLAPLANLLTGWMVSGLFLGALTVGGLTALCPAAAPLGKLVDPLGHAFYALIGWLGRWPLTVLDGENPYAVFCLLALCLMVAGLLLAGQGERRLWLMLPCLGLLLGAAVGLHSLSVHGAALHVAVLDVGQGAAAALSAGGRHVLVDCGGNGPESAGDIAAQHFASVGVRRLDLLILTHFDADHCNGLEELLARMEVAELALPPLEEGGERMEEVERLAREAGADIRWITQRQTLTLGEAVLTLYPPLGWGGSNEKGLFAGVRAQKFDLLITGDAPVLVEEMLLRYEPVSDLDLLIVGHHGAANSTGEALLRTLRPELAAISVGENAYGHPSPETLERLEQAGCQIYRTDTMGTVSFFIRREGYAIRTES